MGIFATYLLLAIQLTSWTMRRLPRKLWHRVHVLSLPMLALATVHGFLAGTDRSNRAFQWAVFLVVILVVFLLAVRLLSPSRSARSTGATSIREPRPTRRVAQEHERDRDPRGRRGLKTRNATRTLTRAVRRDRRCRPSR